MAEPEDESKMSGCVLAVFRNLAGPGLLLAFAAGLLVERPRIGSAFDIAFLIAAAATVLAGMLYKPPKEAPSASSGEPRGISRPAYVAGALAITVVVWCIAHFLLGRGQP